jgi:hypothetical protein
MYDIYVSDNWEEKLEELKESFEDNPNRKMHLEKLADAFFDHLQRDEVEYGGWGVDSKRPFGNSYVVGDIADYLDMEFPEDDESDEHDDMRQYLDGLYDDLGVYLRYRWLELKK